MREVKRLPPPVLVKRRREVVVLVHDVRVVPRARRIVFVFKVILVRLRRPRRVVARRDRSRPAATSCVSPFALLAIVALASRRARRRVAVCVASTRGRQIAVASVARSIRFAFESTVARDARRHTAARATARTRVGDARRAPRARARARDDGRGRATRRRGRVDGRARRAGRPSRCS